MRGRRYGSSRNFREPRLTGSHKGHQGNTKSTQEQNSVSCRSNERPYEVSKIVIDAALKVHTVLGPGLLESTYETCLAQELTTRGCRVERQLPVPIIYEGFKLEAGYRLDLLVDDRVIVEVKSVDALAPVHKAQVLSYLRPSGKSLGLLINFNVVHLRDGIKRFVMGDNSPLCDLCVTIVSFV
ncbi:MAG: GxxExxY protein [Candidatus Korobacteraceae bacterium]